jgi:bla regulator protein blaR1
METINNWFLIFLGNALWQALVIAAATLACDRLLRNASARLRHCLWVVALALCLLIPLLGTSGLLQGDRQGSAADNAAPLPIGAGAANGGLFTFTLSEYFLTRARKITPPPRLAMLALACYWLSLLFQVIKLWRAGRSTAAVLNASVEYGIPESLASIKESGERAFGLKCVALRSSSEIAVPFTAGRRTIVLPKALFHSDASDLLTASIGHEMAHIKRHDFVWNLIYEALSILLAFHPAVNFIKRRIKETRELACDEMVARSLLDAPAYASSLLRLADSTLVLKQPAYTLGVFETDILEERIMKLIERRPRLSKREKTFILAVVISLLTASSALAAVFSLNLEQSDKGQNAKIIGEWDMCLGKEDDGKFDDCAVLIIKAEGTHLTGKEVFNGTHEFPLVDLKFDGQRFSFRIDCGQACGGDTLDGDLKLVNDHFEGTVKSPKRGLNGRMKLTRKK